MLQVIMIDDNALWHAGGVCVKYNLVYIHA